MTGSMSVTAGSFDRLRIEQQKSNALAAKLFVEETLGQPLASDDLHRELKDGVILCRLVHRHFFWTSFSATHIFINCLGSTAF